MSDDRPSPAQIKVVCLGLSRTGTSSMSEALAMLGFGPCYHYFSLLQGGKNILPAWLKICDDPGVPRDLDEIFRGYHSVLDQPPALFPAEMYAAYPDAKFILTTRDPAKWEESMNATVFPTIVALRKKEDKTSFQESFLQWAEQFYLPKYHGGRLFSHTQEEFWEHDRRVRQAIPPEKLLVYQVGEGWERLVKFLNVPKPDAPFPHINDTATFQQAVRGLGVDII